MKRRVVFSLVFLFSIPLHADEALSFLTQDFKGFVNSLVPAKQREKFADYYGRVSAQIKSRSKQEEKRELAYQLRQTALDSLKTNHRTWSRDIEAFLTDPHFLDADYDAEREKLRDFLSWYGALEKFQEMQTVKHTAVAKNSKGPKLEGVRVMDNVRTQMAKAKDKIGGWFRTLKTKLT